MTKFKMASEILAGMNFLGINTENFRAMRIAAGGLENLHNQIAALLGA